MFTWYYARFAEGCQNIDDGVQMRTIMAALNEHGTCPEGLWPHGSPIATEPDKNAQLFSASRLPVYERCDSLQSIKYSLAVEKQPVCIGVDVYNCWYDTNVVQTGIIPYVTGQDSLGGHAITICAYDDVAQLLTIANSWGIEYGDKGFIHYPYAYVENNDYDAWTAGFDTIPVAK
jgi:C1A family cysteine protease